MGDHLHYNLACMSKFIRLFIFRSIFILINMPPETTALIDMTADPRDVSFPDKPSLRSRSVNALDVQIGYRLRMQRIALGFSQEQLAQKLCLTFQQIQKYERGANRVSASRLFELCRVFQVSPDFFFSDLPQEGTLVERETPDIDSISQREIFDLVAAYRGIGNDRTRRQILDIVKTFQVQSQKARCHDTAS